MVEEVEHMIHQGPATPLLGMNPIEMHIKVQRLILKCSKQQYS